MINHFDKTRRHILQGLGLIALASGLPNTVSAQESASTAVLSDELLETFLRMRTHPEGNPVLWAYSGVLVVKPEGEVARNLAKIQGLSRTQAVRQSDGRWLWTLDEAGYFCDLDSGAVAESLYNPFIQETVRPKHYRSSQRLFFSARSIESGVQLPLGVEFRGEITELAKLAGTVAMTEDLYVKMPGVPARGDQAARPARFAASLATFTTRETQLAMPSSTWVDCQFNYTTLNSFVGWLGMGALGGVQDMRLVGIKLRMDDQQAIPSELRRRLLDEHPDLLS